ncbi:MAG TPA: outer membrane beta-barrel protein [Ignavibacteriaceae bacterium]
MKKLFSIVVLLVFAFSMNSTMAQGKNYLGIGANLALPLGTFGDVAGVGFGGTVSFEMEFTPNITGIASAGYLSFGGKDFTSPYYSYSWGYSDIPIMAGVKYYFTPSTPFYGIAQIGFQIFDGHYKITSTVPGYENFYSGSAGSSTEFGFAIGAGYEIPVGLKGAIDLTGTFNLVSDLNYIGVRAAYRFGI